MGADKLLIEVKGSQARLFGFDDEDGNLTFVCTNSFWIGKGDKNKSQNEAIEAGMELRRRWLAATPVEDTPDVRIERGNEND